MKKSAKLLILSLAIMGITTYFVFKLSLSRFKKQVIFQTISEEDKWKDYNELSPATADIIKQYWAEGVGLNFTTEQILNAEHQSIWAWSSAFISWVMRSSGGDTFPVHQTHAHYIIKTTENRNNDSGDFKAYSTDEVKPKASDIVCRRRGTSTATYGNVPNGDTLHCDIVVEVNSDNIEVIGGNVDNKVKRAELSLDENGFLNDEDYFVVIKAEL